MCNYKDWKYILKAGVHKISKFFASPLRLCISEFLFIADIHLLLTQLVNNRDIQLVY